MKRTVLLLALAAAATLLAGAAAWAAAAFAPAQNHPAGDYARAVAAGDFDADGDSDLATANANADTVGVLVRRPDGTFRAPRAYAAGANPSDVARADLDGDGDYDLATTNLGDDTVSVLKNRGDGTFRAQRRYAAGGNYPRSIRSGDLDGDGDLDLVTANAGGGRGPRPDYTVEGTVSVLKNRGDGTFQAARAFVAGEAYQPSGLDGGDFDGDGDLDLVVALDYSRAGQGGLAVLLNAGDGAFGEPRKYGVPEHASDVLADDLDGDGDDDLAAADWAGWKVEVYRGDGDGTFVVQRAYSLGAGAGEPEALTGADFDRDGDLDIATANAGAVNGRPENVSVLENAGDGTLVNPKVLGAGDRPSDITRARMNADRRPDLVVANAVSDDVSVLRNVTP